VVSTKTFRSILKVTSPFLSIIHPQLRLFLAKILIHPGVETLFDPNSMKSYSRLQYKPYLKKIKMDDGTLIYADINDIIGYRIALKKYWDKTTYNFIQSFEKSEILYIDIGANIGSTCIPIANLGYETIAIEANPETSSILLKNISINSGCNATIFPMAVGPKHLNFTFANIYSQSGNMGATSLNVNWNSGLNKQKVISVYLATLDDILKFLNKFNNNKKPKLIIKIDVEGFESEVFDGAQDTIKYFRPEIIFEYNPSADSSKSQFWEKLEDYKIFAINPTLIFSEFDKSKRYENAIAIPKENLSSISGIKLS
jgi:FkbM family methyltransferase